MQRITLNLLCGHPIERQDSICSYWDRCVIDSRYHRYLDKVVRIVIAETKVWSAVQNILKHLNACQRLFYQKKNTS